MQSAKINKSFFKAHPKRIKEDFDKYEAHQEKKEIVFNKCSHKEVKLIKDELRCHCGSAWSGPSLDILYDSLVNQE